MDKFLLTLLLSFSAMAQGSFLPKALLKIDPLFSHHVLLVEKSSHKLFLYRFVDEGAPPELVKTYQIASGLFKGDKTVEGDKKTPEGVYTFQSFYPSSELLTKYGDYGKIYGAGAFTTNYPNTLDQRRGKTGGGIWLHSTDDDQRVSKGLDSKGCVVAVDQDLKEVSQYLDLGHTPIVIAQDVEFLSEETWKSSRQEILELVQSWANAWRAKDIEQYISHYSKREFKNRSKGHFNQYKNYKRAIFARKDQPYIRISNISILRSKNYAVVTMKQDYRSAVIDDVGKKTLYLKQNASYDWKIVAEEWKKLKPEDEQGLGFKTPKNYFDANPSPKEKLVNYTGQR